jgi:hypothetical protein
VHARKGQPHPLEKSRELQRRLYLAAKRSGTRRFHALYDRIVRPDVLWRAWVEVRANGGSPGVDGVSIEDVERQGVEVYLDRLAEDLKAQRYRSSPVLRVEIPKPDGGKRSLGIPTVRDRVVQQACKIVIEPLFEANFLPCSHGYRPKRSAGQAVRAVKEALVWRWWVLDADIEGLFDSEKIRRQTERTRLRVELGELVGALNPIIRGWRAYFAIGNSTKELADLDRYVRLRLWRFLKKRQGPCGRLRPEAFAEWERRSGLTYFYPTGRRALQTCTP